MSPAARTGGCAPSPFVGQSPGSPASGTMEPLALARARSSTVCLEALRTAAACHLSGHCSLPARDKGGGHATRLSHAHSFSPSRAEHELKI